MLQEIVLIFFYDFSQLVARPLPHEERTGLKSGPDKGFDSWGSVRCRTSLSRNLDTDNSEEERKF